MGVSSDPVQVLDCQNILVFTRGRSLAPSHFGDLFVVVLLGVVLSVRVRGVGVAVVVGLVVADVRRPRRAAGVTVGPVLHRPAEEQPHLQETRWIKT